MQSRRLSVVIPGYNNPDEWWRRCIDSVVANLGEKDEIICVDDCSSRKPVVLDEYPQRDSRIRVVYCEKNCGLPVARNKGMELAQGEFMTFVDSDDEILPDTYSKSIGALEESGADIVVFGVRSVWVNERLYKENVDDGEYIGLMSPNTLKRLFDNSLLNYAWNKVYRSSFLKSKGLQFDPDGVPCEDIIFILDCVMRNAKWLTINHVGINYYRTHGSLLSRYKPTFLRGTCNAKEAWVRYKDFDVTARLVLGGLGEPSDLALMRGEWDNIWRPGSPRGLVDRWRFLVRNQDIAHGMLLVFFMKKMIYQFFRKYFYVRPIQRWHIRRMYPSVRPFK